MSSGRGNFIDQLTKGIGDRSRSNANDRRRLLPPTPQTRGLSGLLAPQRQSATEPTRRTPRARSRRSIFDLTDVGAGRDSLSETLG